MIRPPTTTQEAPSDLGYRNLNTGYAHASATVDNKVVSNGVEPTAYASLSDAFKRNLKHDADLAADNPFIRILKIALTDVPDLNTDALTAVTVEAAGAQSVIGTADANQVDSANLLVRRATFISG